MLRWIKELLTVYRGEATSGKETELDSGVDHFNLFREPVTIEITDVIDLHTISPRDVKRVVERYLQLAHSAGFRESVLTRLKY